MALSQQRLSLLSQRSVGISRHERETSCVSASIAPPPSLLASSASISRLKWGTRSALNKDGLDRLTFKQLTSSQSTSLQRRQTPVRASLDSPAQRPYTAVLIIPTGVGAAIGGFAGDALPVARTLSSVVDCLITHPNVLNGAMLYWPMPNTLYVEGYGLDAFAHGKWALQPVHQNRIGIVLDCAIEEDLRLRHMQVADAAQATLGLDIAGLVVTEAPLGVEKWIDEETGQSTGRLGNSTVLIDAVKNLIVNCGAEAIAVVGRFPDDAEEELVDYRQGQGVDALAGVEAVISHMIVEEFRIPCAHAPALQPLSLQQVSPQSAAEEIGYTFFPCVLAGLSRAPRFVTRGSQPIPRAVLGEDVDAVILPADACGGAAALGFSGGVKRNRRPLIIAVGENETVLRDTPERMHIEAVHVANYWEAIGVVAAHKAGVRPDALRKNGTKALSITSMKDGKGVPSDAEPVEKQDSMTLEEASQEGRRRVDILTKFGANEPLKGEELYESIRDEMKHVEPWSDEQWAEVFEALTPEQREEEWRNVRRFQQEKAEKRRPKVSGP